MKLFCDCGPVLAWSNWENKQVTKGVFSLQFLCGNSSHYEKSHAVAKIAKSVFILGSYRDSVHICCWTPCCLAPAAVGQYLINSKPAARCCSSMRPLSIIVNYYYTLHPFNGVFSRTTWVSRYQKGKTSLDLNDALQQMTGFVDGSGISWIICKESAPRSRQITTATPYHYFYRPDALPNA